MALSRTETRVGDEDKGVEVRCKRQTHIVVLIELSFLANVGVRSLSRNRTIFTRKTVFHSCLP